MKLLIDLGNSRLKVALRAPGGGISLLGEARHRDTGVEAALAAALQGAGPQEITGALCANVAGGAAGRALEDALRARGWGRLDFLRASAEAGGVRCSYAEPARLGADRWAALLGARSLTDGACLVVDAGSALTVDAMAPGGLHLGGWIMPGLDMMLEALEARTGDLRALRQASTGVPPAEFPADSGPAMEGGVRLAATGAVRVARERLEAHTGVAARLLLTGGDAQVLLPALPGAEHAPDLVLRGLARAMG
jgi:type III pantothenate kinase